MCTCVCILYVRRIVRNDDERERMRSISLIELSLNIGKITRKIYGSNYYLYPRIYIVRLPIFIRKRPFK